VGLEAPASDASEPEVMKFTSWWTEGGKKKYLHLSYFMKTEEFEIDIADDDKVYRVKKLMGKYGQASCWDLHLTAWLNIFGRKTTLMQADHDTRVWIEMNAKRLLKVKRKLTETLMKYERIKPEPEPNRPYVEMHLRSIMNSVSRLKGMLQEKRPSLADKFQHL